MNSQQLLEFIRSHRLAVQASASASGTPQAAIVGFAISDHFEIVFDTLQTTRKVQNLRGNAGIALVIGGWTPGDKRTVQYEGEADEPVGEELEKLKQVYFSAWPDGPARANWPNLIYICVRPKWIRYSDYNQAPPVIVEFTANDLAR